MAENQNVPAEIAGRAQALFADLSAGRFEDAEQQLGEYIRGRADGRRLAQAFTRTTSSVGGLVRMGQPAARQAGEYAVVEVPLAFTAGSATGRVVYDRHGQAAGVSLQCRRRFRLDPRPVGGFALRSPDVAGLLAAGRRPS